MTTVNKHVSFFKLRGAYLEVKDFIEMETNEEVLSLNSKLVDDLRLSGDDNYDLLEKFVTKYKLDIRGFDYQKHFHTEYELYGSEQAFYNILKMAMILLFFSIRILTFGIVKADLVKLNILDAQRNVKDMTVGDMVTWYLEKEYKLREDIWYTLKNTA